MDEIRLLCARQIQPKVVLDLTAPRHVMILIFWVVYVFRSATVQEIVESLQRFGVSETEEMVRKYLYCMLVAEWIAEKKYGHLTYYYNRVDIDPFEYAFTSGSPLRDSVRWKRDLAWRMRRDPLKRPKPVLQLIGS